MPTFMNLLLLRESLEVFILTISQTISPLYFPFLVLAHSSAGSQQNPLFPFPVFSIYFEVNARNIRYMIHTCINDSDYSSIASPNYFNIPPWRKDLHYFERGPPPQQLAFLPANPPPPAPPTQYPFFPEEPQLIWLQNKEIDIYLGTYAVGTNGVTSFKTQQKAIEPLDEAEQNMEMTQHQRYSPNFHDDQSCPLQQYILHLQLSSINSTKQYLQNQMMEKEENLINQRSAAIMAKQIEMK